MEQTLATAFAAGGKPSRAQYGSDLIIELLAELSVPYIAFNPGSSFRGLHDSMVNFVVPGAPEMVQCCHEEIAVGVAHGYARATGKPIVAAAHDVVGLQHASMAIYNAWCDRIPILVVGGTGPMNSENRRNHIDWVHTALVQGNVVRDFVKWDDQPATLADLPQSLLRGYRIAMTEPQAPVYLCYDVDLQEQPIETSLTLPDVSRFRPPAPPAPDPDAIERAATMLAAARWPVILTDATGRHREALAPLASLAETLCAPVVSAGSRFNIASDHPLNATAWRREALGRADVVLALDCFDLAGAIGPGISAERAETPFTPADTKFIHIGVWDLLQHSLTTDFERLNPVDEPICANTSLALPQLLAACQRQLAADSGSQTRLEERRKEVERLQVASLERQEAARRGWWQARPMTPERLSAELWQAVKDYPWSFVSGGPRGNAWRVTDPEQIAGGGTRGGGLGHAAAAAVGGALALKDAGRLCLSFIGDGDLLYTPSALWTAAHCRLPLLLVVNNNRSYGNDEGHQEYVARQRGRAIENKGVGIFIEDPQARFADIARGFGVEGHGPIEDPDRLQPVLSRAAETVMREKRPVLVEVITQRRGI